MSAVLDLSTRRLQDDDTVFADFETGIALRFFGFVRPCRLWLYGALSASAFFVASQVAIPLVIKWGVDDSTLGGRGIYWVLAGFLAVVSTNAVGGYLQELLAAGLAQ